MALPTLTGLPISGFYSYQLHISSASLTNAPVYTGDGRLTPLAFTTAGISVTGEVAATMLKGLLVFSNTETVSATSGTTAVISPTKPTTLYTSNGTSQAMTLADGTHGQLKTIIHAVNNGSGVLTPATKTGYTTITFTAAGDTATLQFFTTRGWCILALRGATAA